MELEVLLLRALYVNNVDYVVVRLCMFASRVLLVRVVVHVVDKA